jgi:prepilin-type N-terminal cleavage/methylation domain-containing protein/prepilin-type processing-associated H-X9-DG protein
MKPPCQLFSMRTVARNWGGPDRLDGEGGFTLVELLVVIAILGVLGALLLPAMGRVKRSARVSQCAGNIKQIVAGATIYAQEDPKGALGPYQPGFFPNYSHSHVWRTLKSEPGLFICPASKNVPSAPERVDPDGTRYYDFLEYPAHSRLATSGNSYDTFPFFSDMDNYWQGNAEFKRTARRTPKTLNNVGAYQHRNDAFGFKGRTAGPAETWMYSDTDSTPLITAFYPDGENNHLDAGANVGFFDGHVRFVLRKEYVEAHELSEDNNRDRIRP